MQGQPLGRQARGQADVQIGGAPAPPLQLERRVGVLGDGLAGEALGLVQRGTADHRAGAAEEGRVPEVVAGLDHAIEQRLLLGHVPDGDQVPLDRVGRMEVVRRLQEGQPGLFLEPADRHLQEGAGRDVIAVEDADQFARGLGQGVVEVAGLGLEVVGPGDVAAARVLGEGLELGPPAVVEQPDAEPVGRIVHAERRQHGVLNDLQVLVVGGDEDVDRGPGLGRALDRADAALQRPDGLQEAQDQDQPGIELGHVEAEPQHALRQAVEMQGLGRAPEQVAGGDRHRQDAEHQGHAPRAEPIQDDGRQQGDHAEHSLREKVQRRGDDGRQQGHTAQGEDPEGEIGYGPAKAGPCEEPHLSVPP